MIGMISGIKQTGRDISCRSFRIMYIYFSLEVLNAKISIQRLYGRCPTMCKSVFMFIIEQP